MWFELTIALRHLSSRKVRSGLVSIITLITILGVVVGVTALIAVIAVMDGAQEDYLKHLIDQQAHVQIWDPHGERLPDFEKLIDVVKKDPDVVSAAPILKCYSLLKTDMKLEGLRDSRPAQILGMLPGLDNPIQKLADDDAKWTQADIDSGKAKLHLRGKATPEKDEALVGSELAKVLHLELDEDIYAVTGRMARTANGIVPKTSPIRVVGIFDSGVFEIDESTVYVTMETAQDIDMVGQGRADDIQIRVKDPYQASVVSDRLKVAIKNELGYNAYLRTWGEMNPELFRALKLEKLIMFIILLLVVLVAGLNLAGTLILVTMEKTREIGILRAMGVSRRSISKVFVCEGALIGVVGTVIGDILGLALCMFLKYVLPSLAPNLIPEAVYGLDRLPVLVKISTVAIISVSSVAICLIASMIPAYRAARLNVVEALRYE